MPTIFPLTPHLSLTEGAHRRTAKLGWIPTFLVSHATLSRPTSGDTPHLQSRFAGDSLLSSLRAAAAACLAPATAA